VLPGISGVVGISMSGTMLELGWRPPRAVFRMAWRRGPVVFDHACRMGLRGIVSKRRPRGISQAARGTGSSQEPSSSSSDD
jgi:hypothetical protein